MRRRHGNTQCPGREEQWVGTMNQCFPLHVRSELSYLEEQWGSLGLLCASRTIGYLSESAWCRCASPWPHPHPGLTCLLARSVVR